MSGKTEIATPAGRLDRALAVSDWLVREARLNDDAEYVTEAFALKLRNAGVPVDRLTSAIPTLHATRRGLIRTWIAHEGVKTVEYPWGDETAYVASPYYRAHQKGEWVRFRVAEIADDAFGIVPELRAGGFTDYICIPISFQDGDAGGATFATRHEQGFSAEDLAILRLLEPAVSILLDLKRTWRLLRETLKMYVGNEPHGRILSGEVRRGETIPICAAILFADMRGFTAKAAALSAAETVALLNRFCDCVVPAVEASGGEVLKYLGDGVLAIFNQETDAEACGAALDAACAMLRAVDEAAEFDVKIALHIGEVAYGNIGSGARLDYTVVGSDVNLASRLADLGGALGLRLVTSRPFADALPAVMFDDAGAHVLKGVRGPVSVLRPVT